MPSKMLFLSMCEIERNLNLNIFLANKSNDYKKFKNIKNPTVHLSATTITRNKFIIKFNFIKNEAVNIQLSHIKVHQESQNRISTWIKCKFY